MHVRPYQKLIVWQEAHKLCLWIYDLTKSFPAEERFRLTDQVCRASASVPTNITEGCTRGSQKDRKRFYMMASSSLEEVHYELFLARDLGYMSSDEFAVAEDKIMRISYMLYKMQAKPT